MKNTIKWEHILVESLNKYHQEMKNIIFVDMLWIIYKLTCYYILLLFYITCIIYYILFVIIYCKIADLLT